MYMRAPVSIIEVEALKKLIPSVFSHYSLSSNAKALRMLQALP